MRIHSSAIPGSQLVLPYLADDGQLVFVDREVAKANGSSSPDNHLTEKVQNATWDDITAADAQWQRRSHRTKDVHHW